jgi:hypothetical protein
MKSGQSHKQSKKKLTLNKDTLMNLSASDLTWAKGGQMPTSYVIGDC